MKRASTTARGPRLSKNSCARSRYSVLKKRASGLNRRVPYRLPDDVAELRAQHGGDERSDDDDRQVEMGVAGLRGRGERTGQEEDRVARERGRDQARLDEDDEDEADRPEGLDQILGVEPVHSVDHGGEP